MSRTAAKPSAKPGPFASSGGAVRTGTLRLGLWLVLAWFAASGVVAPAAWSQVLDDQVEGEGGEGAGAQGEGEHEALIQAQVQLRFGLENRNFEARLFGTMRDASTALDRLQTLARLKIDEADRTSRLSRAQRQKLELASRGDIERFFDRVDEQRKAFQRASNANDPQKRLEVNRELQVLRSTLAQGLFGDDSLLAKTLRKAVDERQGAALDDLLRQRNQLRQQARLGRVLATLDSCVGLEIRQRRQLLALILEETHPPRVYGGYDVYVVLYQLARLPRERIKPIFHESQWPLMTRQLDTMRAYESMLKQQGVLPTGPDPERWAVPVDLDDPDETPKQVKRD